MADITPQDEQEITIPTEISESAPVTVSVPTGITASAIVAINPPSE